MNRNEHLNGEAVELKPLVGLLHDLPTAMIEQLTVEAIHIHRDLVEKAESRYQALPDEILSRKPRRGRGPSFLCPVNDCNACADVRPDDDAAYSRLYSQDGTRS